MKSKNFTLMIVSVFALVFLMSSVSAVSSSVFTITDVDVPSSVDHDADSFTFTFNLTYTGTSSDMDISFGDSTSSIGDISIPTAEGMDGTVSESRTITGTIDNFSGNAGETINVVVNATTGSSTDDETTFSVSINEPEEPEEITECSLETDTGNLKVKIDDINNNGIAGKYKFGDETEWFPLEEIEVDIEVQNDGDEKIKDIVVEWGLYNKETGEWIVDDEENDFDLKDGDEETITISFTLDDVNEFEDGGDYVFYVWAQGEDTEFDPEVDTCVSDFDSIEIVLESDFVVLDEIEVPETASCGESIQVTADVWNIGEDDQDDVYVVIFNKALGINEKITIGDIDAFDSEKLDVLLEVPGDVEEKTYFLEFMVYDEDNDIYENDFDEDESVFDANLKVSGCSLPQQATVTANVVSGGKAGENLVVEATIINTGNEMTTFGLNAAGYAGWASSANLDQNTVILDKGQSQKVTFTFDVMKDVSGEKSFNIEVTSGNQMVLSQPYAVSIEKSVGLGSFLTGSIISEGNLYLWGIGALNVILVIIIIIVAIRVARK